MASSMASSSSGRQRKRPDLPLIFCPDCGWRKVMEFTSHTLENPDKVFFTCPNQQKGKGKGKGGCEFYLWEEDYVQYLKNNHGYKSEIGGGGATGVAILLGDGTQQEATCRTPVEDEETGLVVNAVNKRVVQHICFLLKALLAVGVVVLGVMICILVVVIMK